VSDLLGQGPLSPFQKVNKLIEGCHRGRQRWDAAGSLGIERKGSSGWAPAALTGLQRAGGPVVVEPRLDVQAQPRGEGPDGREGGKGGDRCATDSSADPRPPRPA
jgi:hypothetical protein